MRTVFAQESEDDLKRGFLDHIQKGYFVEVGAYQPQLFSQTLELEQRGWTGTLVEPQPQLADDLKRRRAARVFAEACSSRLKSGSRMTLYLRDGHSSFEPNNLAIGRLKSTGILDVPVRTLDEILVEAGAPRTIDFVSIDVEGHELDVLDGFDLARWRPRLVLIEDLLLHLRVHRYLTSRGYRCLRRTGINNWYVPAEEMPKLGFDGRWQLFNKFYLGTPFRRARMTWRQWTRPAV
jgi:FkbM family methyltransferase